MSGFLASKLAKFKIPEFMKFQTEKLPKLLLEKLQKTTREEAATNMENNMNIENKVVVVTGAASGIGRALAQAFKNAQT